MILILGTGVAGLSCALAVVGEGAEVTLVTPGRFSREHCSTLAGGNTAMAQGGIAAAIAGDDSPALHAADTVTAGAGIVDAEAAAVLTAEGAEAVRDLIEAGFAVDRDASGAPKLGLEAAHSRARIVHAGEDRTGAALHAHLAGRVQKLIDEGRVHLLEETTAVSLLAEAGVVRGAVLRGFDGVLSVQRADSVVLATGGYAALYARTSSQSGARGEGIVLAARAGALVADLEFVQFHPTVLNGSGFLVSEAVRGAGAVLRDSSGARFMLAAHEAGELAPRDIVSRTVHRVLRERGEDAVWLDATGIEAEGGPGTLARRFPSITAAISALGVDWARELVPVSPAAHYTMGGVATDLEARTSVPGLFAAGEVASTGVHGANRLASNSLLEGLVFGARAGRAALAFRRDAQWGWVGDGAARVFAGARLLAAVERPTEGASDWVLDHPHDAPVRTRAQAALGIEREAQGLTEAAAFFAATPGPLAELAGLVTEAALARTESRGAHQRSDFPVLDPAQARRQAWGAEFALPEPSIRDLRSLAAC